MCLAFGYFVKNKKEVKISFKRHVSKKKYLNERTKKNIHKNGNIFGALMT